MREITFHHFFHFLRSYVKKLMNSDFVNFIEDNGESTFWDLSTFSWFELEAHIIILLLTSELRLESTVVRPK